MRFLRLVPLTSLSLAARMMLAPAQDFLLDSVAILWQLTGPIHVLLKREYRVTIMVRDYVSLTLILKFPNVAQLHCNFCPLCSCPSRIGQKVTKM